MAGRRLWITGVTVGIAVTAAGPALAGGAVSLSSLPSPTVQTLIGLGDEGVTVGGDRFFDFDYVAATGSPAAADVRVRGVSAASSPDVAGLRFAAAWAASDGSATSSTISYSVEPVDPSRAVSRIGLLSNGTAPSPAVGTFATVTLLAQGPDAAPAAPLLTTFDDGRGVPVDTTAADVNAASAPVVDPSPWLAVTDTVTVASGRGTAGVATASVVQNLFTAAPVPEPASAGGLVTGVVLGGRRRRRAK